MGLGHHPHTGAVVAVLAGFITLGCDSGVASRAPELPLGAAVGGTGRAPSAATPFVFVGSTDGSLRAFVLNPADGSLDAAGAQPTGSALDFIALGPDDRTLFVSRNGSVAAYAYDRSARSFSLLDQEATGGGGTHVEVDPSGRYVFVAHYKEGGLSFLTYSASGFGTAQLLQPGSNAHQVRIDPSGTHAYVPCLGSNYVAQYVLNPSSGALTPAATPNVLGSGGPRHLDFHPAAPVAYVLAEKSSQIHVYDIDRATGSLSARASGTRFTADDGAYHWSSDVRVTPDGRFVYAVNRAPPEIVRFAIEPDGSLSRLGADALDGIARQFAVDPAGQYLLVGDEAGNLISFRIATSGALTRTSAQNGLGNIHTTLIRYLGE